MKMMAAHYNRYLDRLGRHLSAISSSPPSTRVGTIVESANPNIMLAVVRDDRNLLHVDDLLRSDFETVFKQWMRTHAESFMIMRRWGNLRDDSLVTVPTPAIAPSMILGSDIAHIANSLFDVIQLKCTL